VGPRNVRRYLTFVLEDTMTLIATHARSSRRAHPVLVLAAMSLGVLVAQIDTSVVSLAVKRIGADLDAGVSQMQWVIDAYNLVYASLLLTGGTLGDLYGRRRIFVLGIALFAAGTIVCALAPNGPVLITGRAISGLGAALELPMSLVLLTLAYPEPKSRAHALGIWASCNGLAFIIGPTLGGFLVDSAGWRSIFYLILPVCAAALLLTFLAVPESAEPRGRKLDVTGQLLAIAALGGLAFAAIEGSHWGWLSPVILSIVALAFGAGVAFFILEARLTGGMVPVELFRHRVFSSALAVAALMTFGMYALLFLMPLYFQTVRGASALTAGLQMLPMSVSFLVVSQLSGALSNAIGPRAIMTAGMACMGVGAVLLAFVEADTGFWLIALALVIVGIGLGLNTSPVNGVAVAAVPKARSGTASGLLNTGRMIGATMGIAILGALFAAFAGQDASAGEGFLPGLRAAMLVGGGAELLGALIAFAFIESGSLRPKQA
jgi:DHA2 family methylenomycin A resistance protein-like MFS transporter